MCSTGQKSQQLLAVLLGQLSGQVQPKGPEVSACPTSRPGPSPSSDPKGLFQVVMCCPAHSISFLSTGFRCSWFYWASNMCQTLCWIFSQKLSHFFLKATFWGQGNCSHFTDEKKTTEAYRGCHSVKWKLGFKPKLFATLSLCSLRCETFQKEDWSGSSWEWVPGFTEQRREDPNDTLCRRPREILFWQSHPVSGVDSHFFHPSVLNASRLFNSDTTHAGVHLES